MYNVVIQNYEEREKELLAENQNLRDTLFNVFSNLKNQFTEKAELGEDSGTVSHRNRTLSEVHNPFNCNEAEHVADADELVRKRQLSKKLTSSCLSI